MAAPSEAGTAGGPGPSTAAACPVIDGQQLLSQQHAAEPPPAEVCEAVGAACRESGCFQLINHGLDPDLLARMDAAMRALFALPHAEKLKVKRTATNAYGYFDDELTKQELDLKEGFDIAHVPHPELPDDHPSNTSVCGHNFWPASQPHFQGVMKQYMREMERCSFKLLEAFCLGLGLPAEALHPLFQHDHTSFCRLNYYPVTPADGDHHWGIHHHTDAGFLTILVQDSVPGLEVEHRGQWTLVQPIPGALTINVGDMCQVTSNDLVAAPQHRVLSPHQRERFSVPYFFNPRSAAVVAPLEALVSSERPPAFRPIHWGQFRAARFAGDYADVGEEVQIEHFRLRG